MHGNLRGATPFLAALGAAAFAACAPGGELPARTEPSALACIPEDLTPDALRKAGIDESGHAAVLGNGRAITPAGTRFATADFPLGLAINAAETRAYVTHTDDYGNALRVLDLTAADPSADPAAAPDGALLQNVGIGSAFRGVALTPDGRTLAVGGGNRGGLWLFEVLDDGRLKEPAAEVELAGYVSDVEVSPDGSRIYAVSNSNSKIFVIDAATRTVLDTLRTGGALPYDLAVSADGATLWSSNLGSNTVTAIDAATGDVLATIPVGKGPEAMALSPDGSRLYVASSDADSVAAIDTATRTLAATWSLAVDALGLKHGNVNGLALSLDGARLYVTAAALNRVDVLDTATGTRVGAIPTGWYPTEVRSGTRGLYVLSSKGMGNPDPRRLKTIPGFLAAIPWADDTRLAAWTARVEANNARSAVFFGESCKPESIPVLQGPGKSPIRHVVLIVRENKTYDMVLGDLTDLEGQPVGDGDPALVVFGEHYTPNFHQLSREFTTLDNYYSNPEVSLQGHQWVTQAQCNDWMEKSYLDQMPIPGLDRSLLPEGENPSIFHLLYNHGVSFRNYGEFPGFGEEMLDRFEPYFDHKYPFWTQGVWDVDKAREVLREWEMGLFPSFVFIGLPNDHTYGDRPGFPTPQTMVADNDHATGLLMDWLSHSTYWPETAVFIIEDDPQGSGDHVDPHRSVCTIVSPWARRGHVSSVHYDIPSIFRTIEMILGVPPMGRNDAFAPPMVDVWVDGDLVPPDETPYEARVPEVPFQMNPEKPAAMVMTPDCGDEIDECPGMGRALWKMMRGLDTEPPPYARGIDR